MIKASNIASRDPPIIKPKARGGVKSIDDQM
jgi:hypothetical protein